YQRPGRFLAYVAFAWAVGIAGVLIVGLFAQAIVGLALWGLSFGAPSEALAALYRPDPASHDLPALLHGFWLLVVRLLAVGWAYAYFWTAAAQLYLLLRHDIDGTAWDDVEPESRDPGRFAPDLEELVPEVTIEPVPTASQDSPDAG